DPLLTHAPADSLAELPEAAFVTAELAFALGILRETGGEWRAGDLPASWDQKLLSALAALWAISPRISFPSQRISQEEKGNPMPSAALLSFLSLAQLPANDWSRVQDVDHWISTHHPFWKNRRSKSEIRNKKSKTENRKAEFQDDKDNFQTS